MKTDNVENVIRSGAFGIALISGILGEADITGAAKKYLETLDDHFQCLFSQGEKDDTGEQS